MILISACVVIAAVLIAIVVRHIYQKSEGQRFIQQQETMKRIREKEVAESAQKSLSHPDMVGRTSNVNELEMSQDYMIPVKSAKNKIGQTAKTPIDFAPVSDQVQYDPTQDFAIFGSGNPTQGGVQNLKEKMNLADVKEQDSEEDLEDIARPQSTPGISDMVNT